MQNVKRGVDSDHNNSAKAGLHLIQGKFIFHTDTLSPEGDCVLQPLDDST